MTKADKIFFITVGSFLALASCALSFALGQERGQRFPVKETNVVTETNTVTVWVTNTMPCDHYDYVQMRVDLARRAWEAAHNEILTNAQKAINRHATLSAELNDWKLQCLQYRTKELDLAFQAKGHPEEITRLKDEIIRLKTRVNEVLEMKAGWRNEEVEKLHTSNRKWAGLAQVQDADLKQLREQVTRLQTECNERLEMMRQLYEHEQKKGKP